MHHHFRHASHLVRLALVLAASVAAFIVLRRAVVPPGFGQFGHYRPAALDDNRARPISFAGQQECVLCHDEQATVRKQGKHAGVSCEACHGPLAKHAANPGGVKPPRPNPVALCASCHEADSAKPKAFPQVVSQEHSGGEACGSCHRPHNPKL